MTTDLGQIFETKSAFITQDESANSVLETAFCCVAQFSSAVSHQSNLAEALAYFRATMALTGISMHRLKHGTTLPQQILSVGQPAQDRGHLGADLTVVGFRTGATQTSQTATGATIVKIILHTDQITTDVISFEFPRMTDAAKISALVSMASGMAVAWRMRQPGLATAMIHTQNRTRQRIQELSPETPILGAENAYGLSRSEYRVCRLLASGLKPQLIAQELGVSIATVRTHLSNIYGKTDLPGQLEVVSHINRSAHPVLQAA